MWLFTVRYRTLGDSSEGVYLCRGMDLNIFEVSVLESLLWIPVTFCEKAAEEWNNVISFSEFNLCSGYTWLCVQDPLNLTFYPTSAIYSHMLVLDIFRN